MRGDFHVYNHRLTDGRALLEEALRLEPKLCSRAGEHGLFVFPRGQEGGGGKFFDQAVKLDSRNYLAHYYHAMLAVEQNPRGSAGRGWSRT